MIDLSNEPFKETQDFLFDVFDAIESDLAGTKGLPEKEEEIRESLHKLLDWYARL